MAAQIVKDFNQLLEVLIQQVAPMTGKNYHFLFKNLIKMNAMLPIQTFNEYAFEWKQQIEKRDDSFFLNDSVISGTTDNQEVITEIFQLREVWTSLDDNSKNNLWEIVQALLMLGEHYKQIKG